MGLHVLLHIGLLGKGSAAHDALEGLLACVTGGRRQRVSSGQCEGAAPRGGRGRWLLQDCAGHSVRRISTRTSQTRA